MTDSQILAKLIKQGGPFQDAIVLRGYRTDCPVPPIIKELETMEVLNPDGTVKKAQALAVGTAAKVAVAFSDLSRKRLYLSARFDKYIDYFERDELATFDPDPNDDSVVVWLKGDGTYTLVTEVPLTTGDGFLRGQLLDDFMSQPGAQSAWDEQNIPTGKGGTGVRCYYS